MYIMDNNDYPIVRTVRTSAKSFLERLTLTQGNGRISCCAAIRSVPSAKLVFLILKQQGSLTQQQICEESLLAARTDRYALSRLEEEGLVEGEFSFRDARQRIYSLSEVGKAAQPAPC